jgi:hypothetical protein
MDGTHLSLRFKHGLHTIFLFVDPLQPISKMSTLLLDTLRERYPEGELSTSQGPTHIPAPDAPDTKLVYASLNNPLDPSDGWERLELSDEDTPSSGGITDGSVLAFSIVTGEAGDVDFVVDWPTLEDYEEGDDTLEPA